MALPREWERRPILRGSILQPCGFLRIAQIADHYVHADMILMNVEVSGRQDQPEQAAVRALVLGWGTWHCRSATSLYCLFASQGNTGGKSKNPGRNRKPAMSAGAVKLLYIVKSFFATTPASRMVSALFSVLLQGLVFETVTFTGEMNRAGAIAVYAEVSVLRAPRHLSLIVKLLTDGAAFGGDLFEFDHYFGGCITESGCGK
jgi:hypothetical protein